MIVSSLKESACVQREYEDDSSDDPEFFFYVEKDTGLIYEVKLFPDYVLLRIAIPDYPLPVQRVDIMTFAEIFEEYLGDARELKKLLSGSVASHHLITKSKSNARDE